MSVVTVRRARGPVDATVSVPGSKSIANRALVCAALAPGRSVIHNVPGGDDVTAMLSSLGRLGIGVVYIGGDTWAVEADGHIDPPAGTVLDAGLAGTTSRFLVALGALSATPVTIDGLEPLRQRPFGPLLQALDTLGASLRFRGADGHLPVTIAGPLTNSSVTIAGDVSSQFISALMMIAPSTVGLDMAVEGELVSRPYVELTRTVMAGFGAAGVTIDEGRVSVDAGHYRATEFSVEPDASSASYPLALAAILGGTVTIDGLGHDSRQGDAAFAQILGDMGCDVSISDRSTTVRRGAGVELQGVDIDMADISDLVPSLAAVAAVAATTTRIRGVGFIRGKESDRLGDLAAEFTKLGVSIVEEADGLTINPSVQRLHRGSIDTHHDHRVAMSAGVLGAAIGDVSIQQPDVVSKSWPEFWTMLDQVTT